tara:strand:+ start:84 stop:434 length:351 start_codon:yes stop_codon:yes gene_type:complete
MANSYKNQKLNLTTNSATTLYTVPSGRTAILKSLIANEKTNQSTTLSVILYNGNPSGGATAFNIYTNKSLTGYSTTELLDKPLVMSENEVLQLTAGHANRCVVVASLLEIFDEKSA